MIVGIHYRLRIIGMTEAESVPELVQRDAEQICVRADVPAFRVIEMHVAGDRFGIRRSGIERVGQDTARPIERIGVAMRASGEKNVDRLRPRGTDRWGPGHLDGVRPLTHGSHNLGLSRRGRQLWR